MYFVSCLHLLVRIFDIWGWYSISSLRSMGWEVQDIYSNRNIIICTLSCSCSTTQKVWKIMISFWWFFRKLHPLKCKLVVVVTHSLTKGNPPANHKPIETNPIIVTTIPLSWYLYTFVKAVHNIAEEIYCSLLLKLMGSIV